MTLRDRLAGALEGWEAEIPEDWQATFDGATPDLTAPAMDIPNEHIENLVYPPLRGHANGPGLFRPFRYIAPEDVRVVVVGQDPYPEHERATGRAFEDWLVGHTEIADSLKRLLQSAVTCMDLDANADRNDAGWTRIRDRVTWHLPNQEAMTDYFDHLAREHGVLFLNAAWTFTQIADHPVHRVRKSRRNKVQRAHRALWRPIMQRILAEQVARDTPTVFLLLGAAAQNLLCSWDGIWRQSAVVQNIHPSPPNAYFHNKYENPLARVNRALLALNQQEREIAWWPPREDVPR